MKKKGLHETLCANFVLGVDCCLAASFKTAKPLTQIPASSYDSKTYIRET